MITRLRIDAAGPFTTIQDDGRKGAMRYGVPWSGAVDRQAFSAAVTAVRPVDASAIELSLGGLALSCLEGEISFALCGGGFTADIDGRQIGGWCRATLCKGESLRIKQGAGNWAYLAFAGSSDAGRWLESRSTHALSGLGGGVVRAGDVLEFAAASLLDNMSFALPPTAASLVRAGIILGPQDRFFAPDSAARLSTGTFIASGRFDRMGRALEGAPIPPLRVDMPSEPALRGCLQVDGKGGIMMLLADHQTTGGYPKIARVIDTDIDRLAQLPTGSAFGFEFVPVKEAVARLKNDATARADYLGHLTARSTLEQRLLDRNLVDGVIDAFRDPT